MFQSGKKGDAHIDVEDHIPKGFKLEFQKVTKDMKRGTDTTYIYYKNKSEDYLCCVIGSGDEPFMIKIGSLKKKNSPLNVILKKLPETFEPLDVKKILPGKIPDDDYSITSITNVLEHTKNIKKKTRSLSNLVYVKI